MSDLLHYPGDCTRFDPDHLMGADMYGAYYRATAAAYNAETNRTALTLTVVPPAELQQRVGDKILKATEEESVRTRIEALFGTVVDA
ncbi:hypothetical protein [Mycobacterium intracellulare]|uniref:hypothetical protein n=1 Tax=Mycobacterium intracellulare TaxID=1767 RepID=UPI00109ECF4B|nr:hypothetical protein [Mycobacterium intracellulare]